MSEALRGEELLNMADEIVRGEKEAAAHALELSVERYVESSTTGLAKSLTEGLEGAVERGGTMYAITRERKKDAGIETKIGRKQVRANLKEHFGEQGIVFRHRLGKAVNVPESRHHGRTGIEDRYIVDLIPRKRIVRRLGRLTLGALGKY
jgi:hypothetical protein